MKLPVIKGLSKIFSAEKAEGGEVAVVDGGNELLMTRRTAMQALVTLALAGAGCEGENTEKSEATMDPDVRKITSVVPELDENALTNQRILVYLAAYTKLTKTQILLVDQHFGIIGGGPIEIPKEILVLPKDPREVAYQEWINGQRRDAKAKYPGINLDLHPERKDAEEPELISFRGALNIAGTNRTYFGSVAAKALGGKFDLVKTSLADSGLPEGLQKLILGIPGVESGYSEDIPNSKDNAVGPWQVMDGLGMELGLYRPFQPAVYANKRVKKRRKTITTRVLKKPAVPGFDHRKDFELTTAKILGHFKSQYAYFKQMPAVVNVMKTYGLSEEDFIFPLVIDSYHAGMGTVGRMVRWFDALGDEAKKEVEERFGKPPYGQDIYSFMSHKRMLAGDDKNYFRRSRDYYAQVAAMAELLDRVTNGKEVETDWPGEYMPPEGKVVDEVLIAKVPSNKINYDDTGTLKTELLESDIELEFAAFKMSEKAKLREKLNPELQAWAENRDMKPMKDMEALDARSRKEGFTTLSENSANYRLRGVGNGAGDSPKNNMSYARVYPYVENMLNDAAEEVNRVAHEAGLPAKYRLRLIVTSAARTEEYQKGLKATNASDVWSSHTLGNSVDISWLRCDIIDTEKSNFTMLIRNDELDKKLKLGALLEAALGRFLVGTNTSERTMALQESKGASTFHTMVLK